MATPTQKDISAYKGNDLTLIWDFIDKETGNDIDVASTYDEVRFIIYADEDNPIYEANLDSGLSVSGNRISCIVSDTENDAIARKVTWAKLNIKIGEIDKTFQVGRYFVYDKKQGAQTDTGFTLNIDNTTQVTSIETSGLYAEAVQAKQDIQKYSQLLDFVFLGEDIENEELITDLENSLIKIDMVN